MLSAALDWAVTFAALVWLAFGAYYTARSRWWENEYGKNAFLVGLTLGLVLLRITFSRWIPDFKEIEAIGVAVYLFAVWVGVVQIRLVHRAQRRGKLKHDERGSK